MTATCDRLLLEQFRHFQDFHKHYNINSIFTKAATVIPLNWLNFQPWTSTGFTLTSWIQIKSTHVETFTCKHIKSDTSSPKSDCSKPTTSKLLIDYNLDKMVIKKYFPNFVNFCTSTSFIFSCIYYLLEMIM